MGGRGDRDNMVGGPRTGNNQKVCRTMRKCSLAQKKMSHHSNCKSTG